MSIRKLCVFLIIVSVASVIGGIVIFCGAKDREKPYSTPVELSSEELYKLEEGQFCRGDITVVGVAFSNVVKSDGTEPFRYYPAVFKENPKRFVIVCVGPELYETMDALKEGKKDSFPFTGFLRKPEDEVNLAFTYIKEMTVRQLKISKIPTDDITFVHYYVEYTEPEDYGVQKTLAVLMIVLGAVFAAGGTAGVIIFRNKKTEK